MTKKIILLFLIWRTALYLAAYLSPKVLPVFANRFPYVDLLKESGLPHFIWAFGNFDGVHYLRIAQDGYAYQFTQVFFPLYPILIYLGSLVTDNLLIWALLISNIAFLTALIIMNKLVTKLYDQKIALWSIIFLLTFPTSFFFGSVYTEGVFFLIIISSFYLAEKNRVIIASILGSFASATRLIGLFLAPALAQERKNLLPLLVVPLGFLAYVIYLKIEFDNPLYFLTAQSIFGQERATQTIVFLPQVFYRYIKILTTTSGLPFINASFELVTTIFALVVLLVAYFKKMKKSYLLFSFLAIITPTLTGTLISMPRYVLIAFPIYITLAQIKSLPVKILIALVSIVLLFAVTIMFAQGYWVA